MNNIKTTRDLYIAISRLNKAQENSTRSLEDYLLAVLGLGITYQNRQFLSANEFYDLLVAAFTANVVDFDPAWRDHFQENIRISGGFRGWQATIINQIIDLHEMDEAGMLENQYRYFGIDSPRGVRWFNFDPGAFLECATAGAYGGWQDGDDTGRQYVPGPVMVLAEDGTLSSRDPREIEEPTTIINEVSWEDFREFLLSGQYYE